MINVHISGVGLLSYQSTCCKNIIDPFLLSSTHLPFHLPLWNDATQILVPCLYFPASRSRAANTSPFPVNDSVSGSLLKQPKADSSNSFPVLMETKENILWELKSNGLRWPKPWVCILGKWGRVSQTVKKLSMVGFTCRTRLVTSPFFPTVHVRLTLL